MSKIGVVAGGVGVETVFNLQFLPEFLLFDNVIGADISDISWNVAGKELVNITGALPVKAFGKFKQNVLTLNSTIAAIFTTGRGYLANQQFQLRVTNNTAGAIDAFAFSRQRGNNEVLTASQVVVLAGANQRFSNFLALSFVPDNVTRIDATFRNSKTGEFFTDSYDVEEIKALLSLDNPTEDGELQTLLVIDNSNLMNRIGVFLENVTLYVTGSNVQVLVQGLAQL